jgi:DMSO/TMAO reductase YedYZ molybdopterin-dependent catalytic subunit
MSRRLLVYGGLLLMLAVVGCGDGATGGITTSTPTSPPGDLQPIVVPTLPDKIPGYTELDPATGLHMTGIPKVIDLAGYRLTVDGKVDHQLSLSYDDLRRLPKVTATPDLVCEGFFVDTTTWSGAPLKTILEMAGVQPDAERIIMKAADGYSAGLTLDEAFMPENFLAYEWMGQPVPVLHGFPLRAVIPGQNGNRWVKWLLEIVVE